MISLKYKCLQPDKLMVKYLLGNASTSNMNEALLVMHFHPRSHIYQDTDVAVFLPALKGKLIGQEGPVNVV